MSENWLRIQSTIDAPVSKVWAYFNDPAHIIKWNSPHESWHTTTAINDFFVGGKFNYRMEAVDGSAGFDFWGIYTQITTHQVIEYTLGDERRVKIVFTEKGDQTEIVEDFMAESENSLELQQSGWQAILDNFSGYTQNN